MEKDAIDEDQESLLQQLISGRSLFFLKWKLTYEMVIKAAYFAAWMITSTVTMLTIWD